MGKTFYGLLPSLDDAHFKKDAGIIPYIMQKHFGYKSVYVTYSAGDARPDFPSLSLHTEQVAFDYIKAPFAQTHREIDRIYSDMASKCAEDLSEYITVNAEKIDVLYIFGFYKYYCDPVTRYKKLNPNGFVYLKTDANLWWINKKTIDDEFTSFLKCCDLITSESLTEYLNLKWPVVVYYLPNGAYDFSGRPAESIPFENKENIIFTAGRLGTPPKATDILLEAFRIAAAAIPSWNLVLAGHVEDTFTPFIDSYLRNNPQLKDRIVFTGHLDDQDKLHDYYRRAKIFALPSRSEASAHVISEAKTYGCFILASDIPSSRDAVSSDAKRGRILSAEYRADNKRENYGTLFDVDNAEELAAQMIEACSDESRLRDVCILTQLDAIENFSWVRLCGKINNYIKAAAASAL